MGDHSGAGPSPAWFNPQPPPPQVFFSPKPVSVSWPCPPPASIQYSLDGGLVRPRGLAETTFGVVNTSFSGDQRVRKLRCRAEIDRQVLGAVPALLATTAAFSLLTRHQSSSSS